MQNILVPIEIHILKIHVPTSSLCCLWTPCNFFRETASIFLTRRDLQSVLLCRRQNRLVVSLSCTKGGFLSNLDTSPPIFGENSNTFGYNLGNYFWRDQLNDWVLPFIDSSTGWRINLKIFTYMRMFFSQTDEKQDQNITKIPICFVQCLSSR